MKFKNFKKALSERKYGEKLSLLVNSKCCLFYLWDTLSSLKRLKTWTLKVVEDNVDSFIFRDEDIKYDKIGSVATECSNDEFTIPVTFRLRLLVLYMSHPFTHSLTETLNSLLTLPSECLIIGIVIEYYAFALDFRGIVVTLFTIQVTLWLLWLF